MSIDNEIQQAFERHENDVRPGPGAWQEVQRRVRRRRRGRLVGAVLGGGMAIAIAVLVLSSQRVGEDRFIGPGSDHTPTTETQPRVIAKIQARVFALAGGSDAIWGLYNDPHPSNPDVLLRVDPRTNRVTDRVTVGPNPMAVTADASAVWVTNNDGCTTGCEEYETSPIARNSLTRIDPSSRRMVSTVKVPQRPQDVTSAFGSVWLTAAGPLDDKGTRLLRFDPVKNEIVLGMRLGTTDIFAPIAHDDRYIWVLNPQPNGSFQVVRIDPATNAATRFSTIPGSSGHSALATGRGSVWVTTIGQDSASGLARLDGATGRMITRITLQDAAPVGLDAVTAGDGYIWTTSHRGFLWKVDPSTNRVVGDPDLIGDTPPNPAIDVVTGFGSVWVVSEPFQIWRLSP